MTIVTYPKRLIEVDLPIKKISNHARREKSIRHGHISTLHIWWARRPLAACRAVICAALWPDPADPLCPERFCTDAAELMRQFRDPMGVSDRDYTDPLELRQALLDFIADFANWDNSTEEEYLATARRLTQSAHEALGGEPGTRPLVVDPFAGGGSIPLEALRVGADAYASDLNPVAVLLNKVVLEYIPKYGQELADEVRKWGQWVKDEAEKELAEFYPTDPDGATPIAYLWARTVRCEGPDCGAEIPLIRSLWLAKKKNRSVALRLIPDREKKRVDFEIVENAKEADVKKGTVKRGSATCPVCGYTTPVASVRKQLKPRKGGANDARLFCVVTTRPDQQGRFYRLPTERDLEAVRKAAEELDRRKREWTGELSLVPDEPLPPQGALGFRVQGYGMENWGELFTHRQNLALVTLVKHLNQFQERELSNIDTELKLIIKTCLSFALDKQADSNSSLCAWRAVSQDIGHTFGRQALPMVWDFVEANVIGGSTRDWSNAIEGVIKAITSLDPEIISGHAERNDATNMGLPNDSANVFFTDPPYYDAVPYADLSDFFYVWLKRSLEKNYRALFSPRLVPKEGECIVDEIKHKDKLYFETTMGKAMSEGRRMLAPQGIGSAVFAHKSTSGWEALLQAMINAGWIITGSWPIDTELANRLRGMNSAALASSVHLVCRPRENPDGSLRTDDIGEWADVREELPIRIHEWMPRLRRENVVGADAIFACLGPALEIYSRYSRVERASGEQVPLKEYLEYVWEVVGREALGMIFEDADASGFEEDARITAMWFWTLKAGENGQGNGKSHDDDDDNEDNEEEGDDDTSSGKKSKKKGYALEFDTARKIGQGLGANIQQMPTLIEVKKGVARMLPVAERAQYLFTRDDNAQPRDPRKKDKQMPLFPEEVEVRQPDTREGWDTVSHVGETVLDRVHQSMILFGNGRSEALRRFLVEDGIGRDPQFWKLAQSLAALYQDGSEEKRWVEGVLARKKGLGL